MSWSIRNLSSFISLSSALRFSLKGPRLLMVPPIFPARLASSLFPLKAPGALVPPLAPMFL